jgi:hypothetical protein
MQEKKIRSELDHSYVVLMDPWPILEDFFRVIAHDLWKEKIHNQFFISSIPEIHLKEHDVSDRLVMLPLKNVLDDIFAICHQNQETSSSLNCFFVVALPPEVLEKIKKNHLFNQIKDNSNLGSVLFSFYQPYINSLQHYLLQCLKKQSLNGIMNFHLLLLNSLSENDLNLETNHYFVDDHNQIPKTTIPLIFQSIKWLNAYMLSKNLQHILSQKL